MLKPRHYNSQTLPTAGAQKWGAPWQPWHLTSLAVPGLLRMWHSRSYQPFEMAKELCLSWSDSLCYSTLYPFPRTKLAPHGAPNTSQGGMMLFCRRSRFRYVDRRWFSRIQLHSLQYRNHTPSITLDCFGIFCSFFWQMNSVQNTFSLSLSLIPLYTGLLNYVKRNSHSGW